MSSAVEIFQSLWVVWAMLFFSVIVLWTYWPRNKAKIEAWGEIPLKDEDEER